MPTYEYKCPTCGVIEVSQKITEDSLKVCPTCGSSVERLISGGAFHLKGSGWYKTDYAAKPASTPSSSFGEAKEGAAPAEKKGDATAAPAAPSTPAPSAPAKSEE